MTDCPDDTDRSESLRHLAPDEPLESVVDDPGRGGTYVLCFSFERPKTVDVGVLGPVDVSTGDYAYVGSAFGPGGFARVDRHRRHLAGEEKTVHWHIDALTTQPEATFTGAALCVALDVECAVAARLPPGPIDGFGSSDCRCRSHLSRVDHESVAPVVAAVVDGGVE